MNSHCAVDDIALWLKSALAAEQWTDFSVNVLGKSEKGDGYFGDIVFVNVKGKTSENASKTYDLVLKCSQKSQALRDTVPVKDVFENEIHLYSDILPALTQFQREKNDENVFDSAPTYYGKFVNDNREILVLQNLKALGYELHDRKKPLSLDHIKLIIREYGKLHAVSAAMRDQQPEKFRKLVGGIREVVREFNSTADINNFFGSSIQDAIDLLQQDDSDYLYQKVKTFKNQLLYVMRELIFDPTYFSVIVHGDCWNNNFMFKYEDAVEEKPVKVAMLDWQMTRLSSPVTDLSYFLYSCTSPEDLKKSNAVLKEY